MPGSFAALMNEIEARVTLPAQPVPRFLDFTKQASSVNFANRNQLFQDGSSPPVQRRNFLAACEHYFLDDAQRTPERSLRLLLGKPTTQLCDDHALSPKSAPP